MAYDASKNPTGDLRERLYLPELLRGLAITTRHFLRNLFGPRDANPEVLDRKGTNLVSTVSYPEEKTPYPPGLPRPAPAGAARGRQAPLRGLLHVRHHLPGAVHLHRGRRVRVDGPGRRDAG